MSTHLQKRERSVLAMLGRGMTYRAIQDELAISAANLHLIVYKIRQKTGIMNTKDAVECRTWERANRATPTTDRYLRPLRPTPGQLEIMGLMAEGNTHAEIARLLGRTVGTCWNQLSQGCKRAGITAQGAHRIMEIRAYLEKISPSQVVAPEDDPAFR